MPRHRINAIIALMVIVTPVVAFLLLRLGGSPKFKSVLKVYDISSSGDTIIRRLPDSLRFTDAFGKPFTREDMKETIWLIHFFNPETQDSLTRLKDMVAFGNLEKEFYHNTYDAPFIRMLAVSTVPVSPESLHNFYQKNSEIKPQKWVLVSGDKETVWRVGKTQFKLPDFNDKDTTAKGFAVTQAVLVDKDGEVRGYYDKYDHTNKGYYDATELGIGGMRTLVEDIRALVTTEYTSKTKK